MKCPVCDNENQAALCPRCSFDSSRDYANYPTFGQVKKTTSASALRKKWQELQKESQKEWQKTVEDTPDEPEPQPVVDPVKPVLSPAESAKPARRFPIWLVAAICTVVVVLGIWIATGVGGGNSDPAEPGESIGIQASPETTKQTMPPETTEHPTPPETTVDPESWRNNILRSDEVSDVDGDGDIDSDDSRQTPVFGSDYRRDQIRYVFFRDTQEDMPGNAWDVSEARDGTVMAWVKPNGNQYDLYIGAKGGVSAGKSCRSLFMGYEAVSMIIFADAFHTDNVQDMTSMFNSCHSLSSLDLSGFGTSNVRDMGYMFNNCNYLSKLNLTSFDTSSVQNMSGMFSGCHMRSLDLSNFDTSNVQDMSHMFYDCYNLNSLYVSNFDTSNVRDMGYMFYNCHSLSNLNLTSFDTSNVEDMEYMFYLCSTLRSLDLSSFDTSNVENMALMFYHCYNLRDLILGERFVTTNADTVGMFLECPAGDEWGHLLN